MAEEPQKEVYVEVTDPAAPTTTSAPAPAVPTATPVPAAAPDGGAIKTGEWGAGLWDCFDHMVPNCCMAWCCPCVSLAQIAHRIKHMEFSNALVLYGLLVLLSPMTGIAALILVVMVMSLRGQVRKRFQIPGDALTDCCCTCCCLCCVTAQMASHVKSYTPGDCSFSAPAQICPDSLPGYQA